MLMGKQTTMRSAKLKVRAVVLDLDGTLVDTHHDFLIALNQTLDDLHMPHVDASFVAKTIGKGTSYLIEQTLLHATGQVAGARVQEQAYHIYLERYAEINSVFSKLYTGTIEALEELAAKGYALACLTNKPSKLAGPLLMKMGLLPYFQCVFGGDAFAYQKPDPLPLLRTCEALGILPRDTIMVGDSINDALAARGAKTAIALVRYGFNHGNPIDGVDADFYLDSLTELPELLCLGSSET